MRKYSIYLSIIALIGFSYCSKSVNSDTRQDGSVFKLPDNLMMSSSETDSIGHTFYAGFLNGKLWISVEGKDNKLLYEQVFKNINSKVAVGYGDSAEVKQDRGYVGNIKLLSLSDPLVGYILLSPDGGWFNFTQLFFHYDSKNIKFDTITFSIKDGVGYETSGNTPLKWGNNEYLMWVENPSKTESGIKVGQNILVVNEGLERLDFFKNTSEFPSKSAIRLGETDYIDYKEKADFSNPYLLFRYDFKKNKKLWKVEILKTIESRSKVKAKSFSKSGSTCTYSFDITNYDGSKETRTYKVDITTGKRL